MPKKSVDLNQLHRLMRHEATPEEIVAYVRDDPSAVLIFATDKLSDDQLAQCLLRSPSSAIIFAWDRMTPEQREYCIRRAPATALEAYPHELTPEQFRLAKNRAPRAATKLIAQCYDPDRPIKKETDGIHPS